MKNFASEFKKFIARGNVMDLAVGVIIGGAFKAIVDSLVNDIISPVIGLFSGDTLNSSVLTIGDVSIAYGSFISAIVNFLIIALVLFMLIRWVNKIQERFAKKEEEPKAEPRKCPYCLSAIPDEATRCLHCTSHLE